MWPPGPREISAELKSDNAWTYVSTRTSIGNPIYLIATLIAHNLARAPQTCARFPAASTTDKRSPLWTFASIARRVGTSRSACGLLR